MPQVFVYGTLRPGQRNHHYMASATHRGTHTTAARYTMLDTGPYPAALDTGETALIGDVFSVDDDTFAALDRLEDYPVHYTRRRIDTDHGRAWIYLWIAARDPRWPVVRDGDWCRHIHERGNREG